MKGTCTLRPKYKSRFRYKKNVKIKISGHWWHKNETIAEIFG